MDAFAVGHDTIEEPTVCAESIVIASIAGEARVHLMCSGDQCRVQV